MESLPRHQIPSSSPDPGPRAGFYYQVIDKPGVRWAGLALLQPPPAHRTAKHKLRSASLQPPGRKARAPPPHPCSPILSLFWGPKGAFWDLWVWGLFPGFALSLLELLKSPWKCVIKQERQRPAGRGRRGGKITEVGEYF